MGRQQIILHNLKVFGTEHDNIISFTSTQLIGTMNTIAVLCMLPFLVAVIQSKDAACDGKQCGHRCALDGDKNWNWNRFGLCSQDGECVKGGELNCATCPTVTVLNVWSPKASIAKYFEFSAEEFSKMVGFDDWNNGEFRIVQSGSHSWEGMVSVYNSKNDDTPFGCCGPWEVNDTMTLKSCSNPDLTPCKDVTYGECDIEKSEILSKTSQQSVQLCNAECYDTYNCTNYRYNNQTKECILTTNGEPTILNSKAEFRSNCNIWAGPVDKFIADCMKYNSDQVCNSHIEEDCEYNGELLRKDFGLGSAITCEKICKSQLNCKYWIYNDREDLCIFKRDGRKTCNGWGGPKEPSYGQCRNQTMS